MAENCVKDCRKPKRGRDKRYLKISCEHKPRTFLSLLHRQEKSQRLISEARGFKLDFSSHTLPLLVTGKQYQ